MKQGLRYNEWKTEWSLVDFQSLKVMVDVLAFWAEKYERWNWKKGFSKESIMNSMMRHMVELMDWEELDPESWLPHIGHIMCNAMFYSYHLRNDTFIVDSLQ